MSHKTKKVFASFIWHRGVNAGHPDDITVHFGDKAVYLPCPHQFRADLELRTSLEPAEMREAFDAKLSEKGVIKKGQDEGYLRCGGVYFKAVFPCFSDYVSQIASSEHEGD
jgi:hypothetical protein